MRQPAIHSNTTEKPKGVIVIGGGVGDMLAATDLAEAGLTPYLVDMVNQREHYAWVHPNDPVGAMNIARELVRTDVEPVRHAEPIHKK
jgi:heterodisulfide reductase subunit A-like polyferredoxin